LDVDVNLGSKRLGDLGDPIGARDMVVPGQDGLGPERATGLDDLGVRRGDDDTVADATGCAGLPDPANHRLAGKVGERLPGKPRAAHAGRDHDQTAHGQQSRPR
jgi:hypothetical protein